jgi:hypothetical protein
MQAVLGVKNKYAFNLKKINIYVVKGDVYIMSRPKPTILLEFVNKKTYKCEQVLDAEAIWAVFFQGKPFNLKSSNSLTNFPGPKYKKVSFSNPGHAHNLAKKLNDMFNTQDFAVYKLENGTKIEQE